MATAKKITIHDVALAAFLLPKLDYQSQLVLHHGQTLLLKYQSYSYIIKKSHKA